MKGIWKYSRRVLGCASAASIALAAIPIDSALAQSRAQDVVLTANAGPVIAAESVAAPSSSGEVRGTTRDGLLPIGKVRVILHSLTESVDRFAISDADGNYVVSDVRPGRYEIRAEKSGFVTSQAESLKVTPMQHLEMNLFLGMGRPATRKAEVREMAPGAERSGDERSTTLATKLDEAAASTANAETVSNATGGNTESTPVVADPHASAMAELDALKKRIDELEGELDAAAPADPSAPADASAPTATPATLATPQESTTLSANADLASSSSQDSQDATSGKPAKPDPFSYADWTWMNANGRIKDSPMSTKYFTPEFRADTNYMDDFNHPKDDTIGGSTESFRSNEFQVEQLSLGGDLRIDNVRGRILTMFGLFATTTPRNDASPARGQWDLANAYRYVSEAWGGYHWNVNYGLNVDAGIFVSYIGLFSYYNYDNWAYQPSFVSSNTPWFFNGLRIQWFPTEKLKIEPWIINGWQSYARYGSKPGLGGQILWRPTPWLSLVFNNYGMGTDTLGNALGNITVSRLHTDDSIEVRYYNRPDSKLDMMAFSGTGDLGCQTGGVPGAGSVSCLGTKTAPESAFFGWMLYNRWQFAHDRFGVTFGGGAMGNPSRYLTLLPPINGANAISGTPYFTENFTDQFKGADGTLTFDYMPSQYITFRVEGGHRWASVPYWTGRGGITPPGGNTGSPASYVCTNGFTSFASDFTPSGNGFAADNTGGAVNTSCGAQSAGFTAWQPDLRKTQTTFTLAILVRF